MPAASGRKNPSRSSALANSFFVCYWEQNNVVKYKGKLSGLSFYEALFFLPNNTKTKRSFFFVYKEIKNKRKGNFIVLFVCK